MFNSSKGITYIIFKTSFRVESYLLNLPFKYLKYLCRCWKIETNNDRRYKYDEKIEIRRENFTTMKLKFRKQRKGITMIFDLI